MVVGRTGTLIVLTALLGLGSACYQGPWYHVESLTLPCGVELKGYFRCGDADCSNYSPSESYQILSAWGNDFRFEPADGQIRAVFVVSGRLILITFDTFGHFVKAVNNEGKLIPLCDLGECSLGNYFNTRMWRDGKDLVVMMDTQGQCGILKGELYRRRITAVFVPGDAHLLVSPDGDINCPGESYEKFIKEETSALSSSETPSGLIGDENKVEDR